MDLPKAYQERMQQLLENEYEAYIESFEVPFQRGLRVNPVKLGNNRIEDMFDEALQPIKWAPYGYYIDEENKASSSPLYYGGFYYIQEPSAMSPVEVLDIKEGMKVLDLCAAPGGKSTQIGGYLNNTGLLVSNDISTSRAYGLLKNIEIAGIRNVIVSSEDSGGLLPYFTNFFDRILVDAPCSGEGMFRKNPKMISSWVDKGPDYYQPIQKAILDDAIKMLKPGGLLVYSTCTFSKEENEDVIMAAIGQNEMLSLVPISHINELTTDTNDDNGVVRLYPHHINGEGHFIAKVMKAENGSEDKLFNDKQISEVDNLMNMKIDAVNRVIIDDISWPKDLNKEQIESCKAILIELFGKTVPFSRLQVINDKLYDFELPLSKTKGLRTLRTGWYIGDFNRDRFQPSQALASGLFTKDVIRHFDMATDDPLLIRYFKGETLPIKLDKGYWLITVLGSGVGFVKSDGKKLKNKFNPSWLMG